MMQSRKLINLHLLSGIGAILLALIMGAGAAGCAAGPGGHAAAGSRPAAIAETRRPLTGAELYAVNCNRCHPERSPTERTSAEWSTILIHMRVRANLPATQAKVILKYLQENSGA